ncbi:MAG: AIR synthase-related protein [bacterium]|nr:AIR synthase-related protein [bacterium]
MLEILSAPRKKLILRLVRFISEVNITEPISLTGRSTDKEGASEKNEEAVFCYSVTLFCLLLILAFDISGCPIDFFLLLFGHMKARVNVRYIIPDARAAVKQKEFESLGFSGKIKAVELRDSYTVDADLTKTQLKKAAEILINPLVEKALINIYEEPKEFDWAFEIGFLPGVTDNVGHTAQETIEDCLKKKFKNGEAVYTSRVFFIEGKLSETDIQKIAANLYNPLIQSVKIKSCSQFKKDRGMGMIIPKVKLNASQSVSSVNLDVSDEELIAIGKQGVEDSNGTRRGPLALDLDQMKTIRDYFSKLGRKPTDVELESVAQTWSEHCKHTIFSNPIDEIKNGLYRTYIKDATDIIRKKKGKKDFCVSVFTDNSGAIEFDENYLITHKVETHNTPSALDPFGGSITGIVGVNRDTIGFGLGAKPVINVYGFCLANPEDERPLFRDADKKQKMLSPKRIMLGVIQGVNAGGNCSGIPTAQGFLFFDDRFKGKPLVFVGTVGLIPKKSGKRKLYEKKALVGDYIVMVGGRVGQDGIHGATFSSEAMDSGSPATAVQIGDPITQKKLSDAIVKEARDRNLYTSITDNGAGGLSCSVAEMAKESGGCLVQLDKVPLKYPGLEPWKIWISESQERMTLAVPPKKWLAFSKLMKSRGVEATVIGKFTNSDRCEVKYVRKTIMDINMNFLHNGLPVKRLKTKEINLVHKEPPVQKEKDWTGAVEKILGRLNITSYEFISKQYDHEVQGGSVIKPIQGRGRVNADVAVVRPMLDSKKGIILSYGINPNYSNIDTYHMAACAIDSAIRAAVSGGADVEKLALLDNFCWCSSNEPERLYQLKRAVKACYDYSIAFGAPFISGKDSMFNDFKGFDEKGNPIKISIPPTLLISAIGVIPDVLNSISIDLKFEGDLIYVLGETNDELGASEYFAMISEREKKDYLGNKVPKVNAAKNRKMYSDFYKCVKQGYISSSITVGRGGLAIALAKMALAGGLGADVSLKKLPGKATQDDFALFSESHGRILVSVSPDNRKYFEKVMSGNCIALIGKSTKEKTIKIKNKTGNVIVNLNSDLALKSYRSTFSDY